ncbi:MAG: hypothetical protein R3357_01840 [Burkholderiales bacterium]|nr:hypothetical protein [Burkholderiales bacterium]
MIARTWLLLLALALCAPVAPTAFAGRLVDLGVFDRADNRRLPVHRHGGHAYVAGQPGHEYRLELRNRTGTEVLAVVSVDGVNVITGETADPSQSGYVIAPHGKLVIQGWRKSLAQTAAFYFTDLADSYAARTGRPDNVGVIGVAVFRKKHVPPPAPIAREAFPGASGDAAAGKRAAPAEAPASPGRQSSEPHRDEAEAAARLGTGHGRREHSQARYVTFERASSRPAQLVELRYDSRANLVARGVIRAPAPCAWPCPQPFPGFAPDPGAPISQFSP